MGMAASQARFLGLTARKNNVEYEGQQVNQQRTVLGNETANYYNDLLGMSVPVPPSVDDYTKTVYSFEDGSLTNTITSMVAKGDGRYKVSYTSQWVDDFSVVSTASQIVSKSGNDYYVGSKELRLMGSPMAYRALLQKISDGSMSEGTRVYLNPSDGQYYSNVSKDAESGAWKYEDLYSAPEGYIIYNNTFNSAIKDEYLDTLSTDQRQKLAAEEAEYISMLVDEYGGTTDDWMVRYVKNTSTNTWNPIFTQKSVLDAAIYDEKTGASQSYINMYTIGSKKKTEEVKQVDAQFEQDATGRIINVTLNPGQSDEVTYAVSTNTVTDQAKYDDAMNQYEYDKAQYDKTIQEVNAKIEIIQAEDKNLELRLKQLDTEQEAIQTEMDAVQKVIEKNTESSFKTFG